MRLLRGTGARGLAGIPPVRGPLIRPLLEVTREEIEEYLAARGLLPVRDPTNVRSDYLRNRVRAELLPWLRRENPRIEQALTRLAEHVRSLDRAVAKAASGVDASSIDALRALPEPVRARALEHAHLAALARLVGQPGGTGRVSLPGGVTAVRSYGQLGFLATETTISRPGVYPFASSLVEVRESDRPSSPLAFDADVAPLPWILRGPRPGDRMRPRGLGGSKKLQDLFVDAKLPRAQRAHTPILVCGSDILCAGGLRASEIGTPTEKTRRVLEVVLTERQGVQ
jgi:tRNA(Ile)-lysidine synthase